MGRLRNRFAAAAISLSLLAWVHALGQTKLWVTSDGAKLKEDVRATSPTVAEVPVGAELTVMRSEGKWFEVTTADGKQGWIYRGKVSETPPATEGEGSGGGVLGQLAGSRIETASADTSRSIRGLSPETAQYADNAKTPKENREALDRVLALRIEVAEVERFLEQGRIGEYAR